VFERNAVHDLRPSIVALSLEAFDITIYIQCTFTAALWRVHGTIVAVKTK